MRLYREFLGCGLGALFFSDGADGGGGWMYGRDAVVSPSHTKRLVCLPIRAPHNSPCTLMRTWLRQMGLALRLVAAEHLLVRQPRR